MQRREFMNILDRSMLGMDYDEKRGILNDYDEHFQIALQEGKSEEDIIKDLGDPSKIAKNYMQRANITQKHSDYEEAKTIDLSKFNPIDNENKYTPKSAAQPYTPQEGAQSDGSIYEYSSSDVENIHAVLSISDIEIISSESVTDDKLLKIEIIYPAMMNENLEQYRISVQQVGNSININQKRRIMNFLNHFVLKEIPMVRITVPKSAKLNNLSLGTERGNIYAKDTAAYTLILNNISGHINAEALKAIDTKITTISGGLKISGLVSDLAKISSVSGSVRLDEAVLNKIDVSNVSGSTDAHIKASSIQCHNVSGKSNIEVLSNYDYAALNSVSGALILHVPDDVSFNAKYSSVSSRVSSDFSEVSHKSKNGSFSYTAYGESSKKVSDIQLSTVSGQMSVKKTLAR